MNRLVIQHFQRPCRGVRLLRIVTWYRNWWNTAFWTRRQFDCRYLPQWQVWLRIAWTLPPGRFQLCEPQTEEAMAQNCRTSPRELLFPEDFEPVELMASRTGNRRRPVWEFELDTAKQQLNQQFGTRDLVGFWGSKARSLACVQPAVLFGMWKIPNAQRCHISVRWPHGQARSLGDHDAAAPAAT